MIRVRRIFLVFFVFLFNACQEKQPDQIVPAIPVDDFFKSPEKSSYSISPDGSNLSYLKLQNKKRVLFVEDLASGRAKQVTGANEKNIAYYFWVSDEELVYYQEKEGLGKQSDVYIINREGTVQRKLNTNSQSRLQVIKDQLIENKYLLVSSNKRDSTVFDVYRLNVRNGAMEMAAKNPGNITNWITDSKGQLRLATSSDGVNQTLLYRESELKPFKPVVTNSFKTNLQPISFSDWEPNMIYAISNVKRDKNALVKLDCNTGKESKVLFSSDSLNVVGAQYSKTRKSISFVTCETWKRQKYYLDNTVKRFYTRLDRLLPGTEYDIIDRDKAEKVFMVRTYTDRSPGAYYLYNPDQKLLKKLSDFNPSIKEVEMCRMKPVTFSSRDGKQIQGYLTLPLKKSPFNLPVVVLPHNRPEGRDRWGYNAEVQFLANRGYAVFQVNYRGSTGYGKEFLTAGFKQWGDKIRDDINDGVKWLIKEKIANPKKVAIYGTGFGGFIALNSVYSSPGIYNCAASNSGVINLFSYLKSVPPYLNANLKMFYEIVGNPVTDVDQMRQVSPIFHAGKITVPLFISQNIKDPRINSAEVVQFIRELRKTNDHITYLEKDNGPFSEKSEETRQNLYLGLEQFLYLNLYMK
jgi:dipeptidyl aminopeptidase/acylaminoacyl peptidase